jgi:hypothetical protein
MLPAGTGRARGSLTPVAARTDSRRLAVEAGMASDGWATPSGGLRRGDGVRDWRLEAGSHRWCQAAAQIEADGDGDGVAMGKDGEKISAPRGKGRVARGATAQCRRLGAL